MLRNKFKTTICLVLLGLSMQLSAQKYSNEFMTIGVSATAQGMSNAVVASVNDGTAGYWNPAGLVGIKNFQVNVMHAEWFAGIAKYDYLSFAKPLQKNKAYIGISVIRLGIDNIPYTFRLVDADGSINYDNVTPFSAADYAGLISYARNWEKLNLKIGGNVKIIHRNIGRFGKAWGFGLDLGLQYDVNISDRSKWTFGLMARDITSTFNAWTFTLSEEEKVILATTGNDIPESSVESTLPSIILGGAYVGQLNENVGFRAELDFDVTTDGRRNVLISSDALSIDPHFGMELGYKNYLFLRAGVGNIQEALDDIDGTSTSYTVQPNFGVGLRFNKFKLDYALTDIGDVSQVAYSHIFSLSLDFVPKRGSKGEDFFKQGAGGNQKSPTSKKRKQKEDDFFKNEGKKDSSEKAVKEKTEQSSKGNNRPPVIEQIDL